MTNDVDSTFLPFLPATARYLSLREHAGVEGSFQIYFQKKFDNSFRVNKALRDPYTRKTYFLSSKVRRKDFKLIDGYNN